MNPKALVLTLVFACISTEPQAQTVFGHSMSIGDIRSTIREHVHLGMPVDTFHQEMRSLGLIHSEEFQIGGILHGKCKWEGNRFPEDAQLPAPFYVPGTQVVAYRSEMGTLEPFGLLDMMGKHANLFVTVDGDYKISAIEIAVISNDLYGESWESRERVGPRPETDCFTVTILN